MATTTTWPWPPFKQIHFARSSGQCLLSLHGVDHHERTQTGDFQRQVNHQSRSTTVVIIIYGMAVYCWARYSPFYCQSITGEFRLRLSLHPSVLAAFPFNMVTEQEIRNSSLLSYFNIAPFRHHPHQDEQEEEEVNKIVHMWVVLNGVALLGIRIIWSIMYEDPFAVRYSISRGLPRHGQRISRTKGDWIGFIQGIHRSFNSWLSLVVIAITDLTVIRATAAAVENKTEAMDPF